MRLHRTVVTAVLGKYSQDERLPRQDSLASTETSASGCY